MNISSIKILHWNSNRINKRINKLYAFAIKLKFDIILVNYTHLKSSQNLKITNYHLYRTDLPLVKYSPTHGGTAILIHRRIVHQPVSLSTKSIQSLYLKIKSNDIEIFIFAIYKSPKIKLDPKNLNILTKNPN